jgi:hypothetical protein
LILAHARYGRGLLVLEIKDWNLDTIFKADPEHFTLATGTGHKVVGSPLKQVRQFAHAVVDLLRHDPNSHSFPDSDYAGQLAFARRQTDPRRKPGFSRSPSPRQLSGASLILGRDQ